MDEHQALAETGNRQQQALYRTARALADCETLADAAPLLLGAVCEAFDWQCGAP